MATHVGLLTERSKHFCQCWFHARGLPGASRCGFNLVIDEEIRSALGGTGRPSLLDRGKGASCSGPKSLGDGFLCPMANTLGHAGNFWVYACVHVAQHLEKRVLYQ